MKVLLRTAQKKIALGPNSHMAYFTLNSSDIPIARNQNELARLLNAPPAHSVVLHDDYFAVKDLNLLSWLRFSAVLGLRCRALVQVQIRTQTQARRMMMLMMIDIARRGTPSSALLFQASRRQLGLSKNISQKETHLRVLHPSVSK